MKVTPTEIYATKSKRDQVNVNIKTNISLLQNLASNASKIYDTNRQRQWSESSHSNGGFQNSPNALLHVSDSGRDLDRMKKRSATRGPANGTSA